MTKKYFGTDGIRGAINSENINGDMFFKFGLASGTYFKSQKKKKQIAIITKGKPIARLVASKRITIPIAPIISSTGTLNPNISLTKSIPPLFTKSS